MIIAVQSNIKNLLKVTATATDYKVILYRFRVN